MGPESLAGVLMDVTMTTKDLLGEGGSESVRVELWKLVIRCRERIKAHALCEVVSYVEIVQLGTRMHLSLPRVKVSLNKLDELGVWRMNTSISAVTPCVGPLYTHIHLVCMSRMDSCK